MATVKINVKWNKELLKDIEVDSSLPPAVLKAQLFSLTNVPIERQKIMAKGQTIGDDAWGKVNLTNGLTLLMMGSADPVPELPTEKVKFLEDMTEAQLARHMQHPGGLKNLGNTCYMNATLQCLKGVPELRDAVKQFLPANLGQSGHGASMMDGTQMVTNALKTTYQQLDVTSESIMPLTFLATMHREFPRFAEKDDHGHLMQQDANEFWVQLMQILQMNIPGKKLNNETNTSNNDKSFVDQYFGINAQSIMKCHEAPEETPTVSEERLLQLSCFISQDVKYLLTGLKNRLEEQITKHSSVLGRDAVFNKATHLSRLPAYLTIQFVRFFYKEKEKINAKILKDVQYSMILDVFDLCTPELQKRLMPIREKIKIAEDAKLDRERAKKLGETVTEPKNLTPLPTSFPDDIGSNNSGFYQLNAVLTHKGRSSSSGHYVAWVRRTQTEWLMFDDENVTPVTEEDVLKLSGGGDWHTAYLLIYGPRTIEYEDKTNEGASGESNVNAMDTTTSSNGART
jgi:ubiquitin carboxyl-terminal hydrolase 14